MKYCSRCSSRLSNAATKKICKPCQKVCECGKAKDHRADHCLFCANKLKAQKLWSDDNYRQRLRGILDEAQSKRKVRYADLELKHFCSTKEDGRRYAWYWDENDNHRTIYIYQWLWRENIGDIPKGYIIHHKDGDCLNNDLSNLELLTQSEHLRRHNLEKPKAQWICQFCGKLFSNGRRGGDSPRKFCSKDCHYDYCRKHNVQKCETFQAGNKFTKDLLQT